MSDNSEHGADLESGSFNTVWNNTFIDNNGAGSTYDPDHIQANDAGTNNWWSSTDGYGNYWSDWTTPDADFNGIVDEPYDIDGAAGAKDYYPRTTPAVIPEFSSSLAIIGVMVAMMAIMIGLRRRGKRP